MQAQISRQDGCVILRSHQVHLGSRLFGGIQEALRAELHGGAPVIFDAGIVRTVDGGGLGALLGLLRMCEPGHEFLLAGAPDALVRALSEAHIAELFPLFASVEDALEFAMPLLRLRKAVGEPTISPAVSSPESRPLVHPSGGP